METRLRELPLAERIKLVEGLWDSIAGQQNALPITPEQKAELDRRLDVYENDANPGRLADEVVAEIRKAL